MGTNTADELDRERELPEDGTDKGCRTMLAPGSNLTHFCQEQDTQGWDLVVQPDIRLLCVFTEKVDWGEKTLAYQVLREVCQLETWLVQKGNVKSLVLKA